MSQQKCSIDLSQRHVMAIINVTPDSFYDRSRVVSREAIESSIREAISAGATILDIGGYSSRPGAADVDVLEECRRVELGCSVAREVDGDIAISIDTFRSEVVEYVVERFGRVIVNDITAAEHDPNMIATVAKYDLPYIAMHMRGTPQSMQSMTEYVDLVDDVVSYFRDKIVQLREAGVRDVVIDPGFGFAKSLDQNYELLSRLDELQQLGAPLLVGVSRKSMIYRLLDCEPKDALSGTLSLGWEALRKGASILRVHDTREAVQSLRVFEKYNSFCQ